MKPDYWIAAGVLLYLGVLASWVMLGQSAQWPLLVTLVSAIPLAISFLCMVPLRAKPFFYAALTLMLYIAFTITQITVAPDSRQWAIVVLGLAIAYLAILKFVLQALNARLQSRDRALP